ncbi:hypothetical protein SK803_13805 [Lentzea sp. BCCO 10_0856]|uniref:Uncharacterized protein n=1 Tax=Lentzea miocenica TaxID=3095431 RepID=A0ABU4T012_9PSEU|nr:hypothetical protein [Lentzea sp. BCCO 10_0856]MDX8031298.1 hypothetical protein [Lentzea sp. BCCO 10_0856]
MWFDVIAKGEEPSHVPVNTVRFSPGARTAAELPAAVSGVDSCAVVVTAPSWWH